MTRVVRSGMFETNSSSTHSISIVPLADGATKDMLPVDADGVCSIYGGEYGWEYYRYHDAAIKASYLMTAIMQSCEGDADAKEAENSERALMLKEVIKEETKAKEVRFCRADGDYWKYGYIDHQSSDVADDAFESKEAMRDFIFNEKSVLVTDNDN